MHSNSQFSTQTTASSGHMKSVLGRIETNLGCPGDVIYSVGSYYFQHKKTTSSGHLEPVLGCIEINFGYPEYVICRRGSYYFQHKTRILDIWIRFWTN